ncbi:MAG: hypothetical protein DRQ03_08575 [Candidatus Hydrothermota bacterium]|nr:MAG: hypothetical protein DRQ03_08575 [Candidatus Hydrothermae bacterium]
MDTETLKLVINEQRDEIEKKFGEENIIEREIQNLIDAGKTRQVLVVTGVRRCGKSILAHLFLRNFKYAHINFDDERLETLKTAELNKIIGAFYELYGEVNFMIFDEIQNIPKWELFITRLHRSKRVIITGSNSRLLSGELATHLTGRHIDITLFPFSLREFLKFKGLKYDIYLTRDVAKIKNHLKDYLIGGGFPEGGDKEHIRSIYNDIVTKDILLRHNIKFRSAFKEFVRLVVTNFSNEITYSALKNAINVKSVHTTRNYLSMLEEAFLVFRLPKFSFRFRDQIREPKKAYVVDNGIINVLGFRFSENIGRFYENTVFVELKRKQTFNPGLELYYYKDISGHEVDFVIKEGSRVKQLIQVCYDLGSEKTKQREIRALLHASKNLNCKDLLIITEDYEAEEDLEWFGTKRKVRFMPLWKWLLS